MDAEWLVIIFIHNIYVLVVIRYGIYSRFQSLRSSGLQQEVSSPSSSEGSHRVSTVVALADGTSPVVCSVQLESAFWNTYRAEKKKGYGL